MQEVNLQIKQITQSKMQYRDKERILNQRILNGQETLNECSKFLVIREVQIQMTLRFHLMTIRMAMIENSSDSTCWQGCGEKGTPLSCWWDCKWVQSL